MAQSSLVEAARTSLKDASRFLLFDASGNVLAASFEADKAELEPLAKVFDDREEAIKHGITLQGTRYEVHRHHPPLVYGRTMRGPPESSEGIAVCKVDAANGKPAQFAVITYAMPNVSARMVPLLASFCQQHLTVSS